MDGLDFKVSLQFHSILICTIGYSPKFLFFSNYDNFELLTELNQNHRIKPEPKLISNEFSFNNLIPFQPGCKRI